MAIPASGEISLSDFYGTTQGVVGAAGAAAPPPPATSGLIGNIWFHYTPIGTSYRGDWQVMEITLGSYTTDFGIGSSSATGWKYQVLSNTTIDPVNFGTGTSIISGTGVHRVNWDANGTPSGSTGVVDNGYLYAETSSGSNAQFVIKSPEITLTSGTSIALRLVYGRYGSNIGACKMYWRSTDLTTSDVLLTTTATSSTSVASATTSTVNL